MNLNDFLERKEQTENESFQVTNDEQANWALRKIKEKQEEMHKNTELAVAEISKIEEWMQSVNGSLQDDVDYFLGLLSAYALKKRDSDPKFKSKKLPNGAIRFKKQQPKFNYDNDTVIDSLKKSERTDLIRTKEEPDKSAIKKAFVINDDKLINPDTGEIVKGVEIEHRDDKFEVVTD